MYDKEYVNEQVNICHSKLEEIMESMENGEDIEQALINLDAAFEIFYDRWVLFFTNYGEPNGSRDNPNPNSELQDIRGSQTIGDDPL